MKVLDFRKDVQETIDLSFEGLRLDVKEKGGNVKQVLDGSIRGRVQPGRMLAIMGPSGAGMCCLDDILHGGESDEIAYPRDREVISSPCACRQSSTIVEGLSVW